jgi:ribosome biogenesis protein YTM1
VTAVAAVGGYHGAAAAALLLASGSADGVVRLWRGAGEAVLEFAAHKGGVNALAPVPAAGGAAAAAAAQKHAGRKQQKQQQQQQQEQQAPLLLSAGKDHKLRLWCLQGGDGGAAPPAAARCVAEYCGHSDAVQAVAADPGGTRCASGGWDGQLLLWRAGGALADGEQAAAGGDGAAAAAAEGDDDTAAPAGRKKRKVGAAGAAAAAAPAQLEPLAPLMGHVHCVSALAWPRRELLLSGGWDHSVRRWDLTAGEQADSYAGSKVVLALAAPAASDGDGGGGDGGNGGGGSVVAFAGSDGALRLWDWRAPGEALAVRSVAAHAGGSWVAALAWRPGSAHHLASAGYDGRVKLWDVRSNVPLADLEGHGGGAGGGGAGGGAGGAGAAAKDKALCVGWWRPGTLVSGGSDCQLRLYEMPS